MAVKCSGLSVLVAQIQWMYSIQPAQPVAVLDPGDFVVFNDFSFSLAVVHVKQLSSEVDVDGIASWLAASSMGREQVLDVLTFDPSLKMLTTDMTFGSNSESAFL